MMLACGLALAPPVTAEVFATTTPRGIYTVKVAGKPAGESQARTYLGIQLLPNPAFHGLVGGVSGHAVSLTNVGSPAELADPERTSYLHVITGNGKGFITDIEEFRATDIRCAEDLTAWMQAGTEVVIRPHSNLADLFGLDNRFGLASGPDAGHADNVVTWDPVAQAERVYYFHSVRGRWEEKDSATDANRAVMRFPYGIYIIRRSAGTLRLALSGEIGSDSVLLPVRTGANVFSLPINLSTSLDHLISSVGDFAVKQGPNANSADLLTFEEPSTGYQRGPFYNSSRQNSPGWHEVGVNDSTAPIQPLDFISTLILRRHGAAGYVLAQGSLLAGSVFPLPPDPEPGETPLTGEMLLPTIRPDLLPYLVITIETSPDLQTWTTHPFPAVVVNNRASFQLPAGQTRAFYRVKVTMP